LKIICELGFSSTLDKIEACGKSLVVGSDGEIFVYDLASMKLETKMNDIGGRIRLLCSNASKNLIAFVDESTPNTLKIYDLQSRKIQISFEAHKSKIVIAKFSPNGEFIATASEKVRFT
jgi:WD40 repeat protein